MEFREQLERQWRRAPRLKKGWPPLASLWPPAQRGQEELGDAFRRRDSLENTTWVPPCETSRVTIVRDGATGRLVGRISWLKDAAKSRQRDFRNPRRELRQRTLLGLPILVNVNVTEEDVDAARCQIYDPNRGWQVPGRLQLNEAGDKLRVKGSVGVGPLRVSRSYTWSRLDE